MQVVLDPVKLRAWLKKAGYSQGDLGRMSGIPQSHITRFCRVPPDPYDYPTPNLKSMARLASALGLESIEPLLRYLPDRKERPTEPLAASA